jgi:hypothetical protein
MDSALTTIYSKVDLYSTYKGSTVPTKVFYSCKALVGNGSSYSSSNVSGDALSFANYLTEIQYAVA